ncbi:hypothetical protein PS406_07045 [Pediococcus acidilactici]
MKKLMLMVAMLGMVGITSVKASETQVSGELTRTTVTCKNGTVEALKNNTNHVIDYEFIGPINCGGVNILSKGTYRIYPRQTYMTNKRVGFSY